MPENIAIRELEQSVFSALETYSNVHRGSGHFSMVTTLLYEKARDIVLDYLGLVKGKYTVIFCTPARESALKALLNPIDFKGLSSRDIGLSIGIRALAVRTRALPAGIPFQSGGGTARLVSPDWVVWANIPDRFEAGISRFLHHLGRGRGNGRPFARHSANRPRPAPEQRNDPRPPGAAIRRRLFARQGPRPRRPRRPRFGAPEARIRVE